MTTGSNIVSFVLRFVSEEQADEADHPAVAWYGVVRHVQSDTERHLTSWDEIVAFVAEYVDLSNKENRSQKSETSSSLTSDI